VEQGGSCIRYPYDFEKVGQVEMDDPAEGRAVPTGGGSANCTRLLGLFSCATYSPTAGDFITGMALVNGTDPTTSTIDFQITVCESFCEQLLDACSVVNESNPAAATPLCGGATGAADCCGRLGPGVTMVANDTAGKCYSGAAAVTARWQLLVAAAVVAALAV
jgi:hypothetical protein